MEKYSSIVELRGTSFLANKIKFFTLNTKRKLFKSLVVLDIFYMYNDKNKQMTDW